MFTLRALALTIPGLLAFTVAPGHSESPQKDPPVLPSEAQIMQVKLKRAHALLEALTKEDYKTLEENANSLVRISDGTEFLTAYKTAEYQFQAQVFKRNAETLATKARAKHLDGATLAYVELTLSCVKCHNTFRGKKRD
jgi:cytochrome c556